ncbi:CMRF35-like molecule 7 [Tachyglossus aculeatus]|uniref:CMRF35-like molecule 7 n=1 Tax=Tachyglossus aculeatus TaxID=9261 RepID=UPI0018F542C8|nr:CMRF35-like molecule 7 [Tachyglossus aculeatus]
MRFLLLWAWSIFPGCFSLTGPRHVQGTQGKPLTVSCLYREGYEEYNKYWCRGAQWASCKPVVETWTDRKLQNGRTTIRDFPRNLKFEVTIENLAQEDQDFYWCAIDRLVARDYKVRVRVTVSPSGPTQFSWPDDIWSDSDFPPPEAASGFRGTTVGACVIVIILKILIFLGLSCAAVWRQKYQTGKTVGMAAAGTLIFPPAVFPVKFIFWRKGHKSPSSSGSSTSTPNQGQVSV